MIGTLCYIIYVKGSANMYVILFINNHIIVKYLLYIFYYICFFVVSIKGFYNSLLLKSFCILTYYLSLTQDFQN